MILWTARVLTLVIAFLIVVLAVGLYGDYGMQIFDPITVSFLACATLLLSIPWVAFPANSKSSKPE